MIAPVVAAALSAWLVGALLVGARFAIWYGREFIGARPISDVPRADWIVAGALVLAVAGLWPYVLLVSALVRIVEGGRP